MGEHAQVAQENDEDDRGLELNGSPHTGMNVQENLIEDILELFSAEVAVLHVVFLGDRVVVVIIVDLVG